MTHVLPILKNGLTGFKTGHGFKSGRDNYTPTRAMIEGVTHAVLDIFCSYYAVISEGSATSLNPVQDFEILGFHRISRFREISRFQEISRISWDFACLQEVD